MKSMWMMRLGLSTFGLLFSQLAQAQFCGLTNASLHGTYGYVASEAGTLAATTSGTGTTGTTGTSGTSGTGTTGTSSTGTGTTGSTTNGYSNTDVGQLLNGITSGNLFGYSGVLVFDGAGSVYATSSAPTSTTTGTSATQASTTGSPVTQVGTYNVNSDCTVSVSLTDAFGTNTTATNLAGIVLGAGAEIDLTAAASLENTSSSTSTSTTGSTGTSTTTTGTTTTGSGSSTTSSAPTGSDLTIRLVRVLYQNGCTVSNLRGLYGFVLNPIAAENNSIGTTGTTGTGTGTTGTGTGTTGTGTTGTGTTGTTTTNTSSVPSIQFGYIDFDGAGQIIALPNTGAGSTSTAFNSGSSSTSNTMFSALQFTGTYSVNPDCSGTMTLSNSSTSTASTTGTSTTATGTTTTTGSTGSSTSSTTNQSITVNFVITPPVNPQANPQTPGLTLSFTWGDESGSGYALAQ
jgi:hypothetical protein